MWQACPGRTMWPQSLKLSVDSPGFYNSRACILINDVVRCHNSKPSFGLSCIYWIIFWTQARLVMKDNNFFSLWIPFSSTQGSNDLRCRMEHFLKSVGCIWGIWLKANRKHLERGEPFPKNLWWWFKLLSTIFKEDQLEGATLAVHHCPMATWIGPWCLHCKVRIQRCIPQIWCWGPPLFLSPVCSCFYLKGICELTSCSWQLESGWLFIILHCPCNKLATCPRCTLPSH